MSCLASSFIGTLGSIAGSLLPHMPLAAQVLVDRAWAHASVQHTPIESQIQAYQDIGYVPAIDPIV